LMAALAATLTIVAITLASITAFAVPAIFVAAVVWHAGFGLGCGFSGRCACTRQPVDQALEQANALRGGWYGGGWRRRDRGWLRGRDALDQCFGAALGFLRLVGRPGELLFRLADQLDAGLAFFQARIVVAQALDMVMRCFQILVGNQDEVDLQAGLDLG